MKIEELLPQKVIYLSMFSNGELEKSELYMNMYKDPAKYYVKPPMRFHLSRGKRVLG